MNQLNLNKTKNELNCSSSPHTHPYYQDKGNISVHSQPSDVYRRIYRYTNTNKYQEQKILNTSGIHIYPGDLLMWKLPDINNFNNEPANEG